MRKINLFILILFLTVSSFSQTNQKSNAGKVAQIDTSIFNDSQQGIKVLIKLQESFTIEYKARFVLSSRIEMLESEINYLQKQNRPVSEKNEELQKLKVELKNARKETETERNKRYYSIATPIAEKITMKIKEFAKIKGYAIIIDKFQSGKFIDGETKDVTKTFIQFCNEGFEKENSQ